MEGLLNGEAGGRSEKLRRKWEREKKERQGKEEELRKPEVVRRWEEGDGKGEGRSCKRVNAKRVEEKKGKNINKEKKAAVSF